MTLLDGEGNRGGSGDRDRSFRRRFPGEVGGSTREREGVVGLTETTVGSVLGDFAGLGLGSMEVFWFGANGRRGLLGVTISTASMIILCRTGVVGVGGTGSVAGSLSLSSDSASSSSTTVGTLFFVVRDRVVLVAGLEGPALAVAVRVVVRVEGGLAEEGLVEDFFGGSFASATFSSTTTGRTPGGPPRRLGASVVSASVAGSTSIGTVVVFLVAPLRGTLTGLDSPAAALDRVVLASGFFFAGSGGSEALGPGSAPTAARRVVRTVARVF